MRLLLFVAAFVVNVFGISTSHLNMVTHNLTHNLNGWDDLSPEEKAQLTKFLSPDDLAKLKAAALECEKSGCCHVHTAGTSCPSTFLKCVLTNGACIWEDCEENPSEEDESLDGINDPGAPVPDEQDPKDVGPKEGDDPDDDLDVFEEDHCGLVYKLHNTNKQKLEEDKRLKSGKKEEEAEGGGQAFLDLGISMTNNNAGDAHLFKENLGKQGSYTGAGEINKTALLAFGLVENDTYVANPDGRVGITSWQWPYYKNCFVLFTTSSGRSRCSGSLVSPRHVLTAGHCVSDGHGNFYTDFEIQTNMNAGNSRTFGWSGALVFNNWHHSRDWGWDIGMITLNTDNTNFGWYGFGWWTGIGTGTNFDIDGYPADKGRIMQRQTAQFDYAVEANILKTRTGDIMGGNSGGAAWYQGNKVIYGVVSYEWQGMNHNGVCRITQSKFDTLCRYIARWPNLGHYLDYI